MSDIETTPLNELTPMNPEVLACPHLFNERLRREAPVYQCPHTGITFVSDYETITRIAKDHETFSNRFSTAMPTGEAKVDPRIIEIQKKGYPPVDTMLTQDPPVHRRYRGMVNQAFTARRVATLEPYIEQLCHELIDGFIDAGGCEFVVDFAERVPLTVIAEPVGRSTDTSKRARSTRRRFGSRGPCRPAPLRFGCGLSRTMPGTPSAGSGWR